MELVSSAKHSVVLVQVILQSKQSEQESECLLNRL